MDNNSVVTYDKLKEALEAVKTYIDAQIATINNSSNSSGSSSSGA